MGEQPDRWEVIERGRRSWLPAGAVIAKLQHGELLGDEPIRREGDPDFRPIIRSGLYRQAVPMGGIPPAAIFRRMVPGLVMLGVWVAMLLMPATNPDAWWGPVVVGLIALGVLGQVAHRVKHTSAMLREAAALEPPREEHVPTVGVPPALEPDLQALSRRLAELRAEAGAGADPLGAEIEALRREVDALRAAQASAEAEQLSEQVRELRRRVQAEAEVVRVSRR